jgi:hypothetical protein
VFYCGNPVHSPFDHRHLAPELLEEGFVTPQAIPRSSFKMLKPENERTLDQPEEEIENLQTIDCFDFV